MLFLARKNLVEHPVRLLISTAGVALAVMLALVVWGILAGVLGQAGALVRNTDAQIWIVQKGFTDMAHGLSVLPDSLRPRLRAIPGVRSVNPITGSATEFHLNGEKESLLVVGYDTATGVGGPWRFATEPRTPKRGQLVVDATFAKTAGVDVGDTLPLPDHPRRIVALSSGTNQFTNQLAFASLADARTLVRLPHAANFYALQVERGKTEPIIAEIRRRFPSVTPFTKAAFVANNEREIKEGFRPILYVIVAIAFFVGLAVVGLTMYTATVEKAREYGVLAAIGAGRRALYGVIVRQSVVTAALGFLLGSLLVVPASKLISVLAPKTALEFPPTAFVLVAAGALAMSIVASYVPIRRLAGLDPAAVFRA